MLGGIGDLVVVDRRSGVGVSYCGTASTLAFATMPAAKAPMPTTSSK